MSDPSDDEPPDEEPDAAASSADNAGDDAPEERADSPAGDGTSDDGPDGDDEEGGADGAGTGDRDADRDGDDGTRDVDPGADEPAADAGEETADDTPEGDDSPAGEHGSTGDTVEGGEGSAGGDAGAEEIDWDSRGEDDGEDDGEEVDGDSRSEDDREGREPRREAHAKRRHGPSEEPSQSSSDDGDDRPDLEDEASEPTSYDPDRKPGEGDNGREDDEDKRVEGVARVFAEPEEVGEDIDDFELDHAPDDEEQPLEVHVTEMVHRLLAVAVVILGVAGITLLWSDDLINFLWYSFLGPGQPLCPSQECPRAFRPRLYHPLSLVLARLKVSVLVGFVVGLPVAVYQTYLFMRPGLYPRERRYYLAAVPTSLVLATVGVAFAYFLILPALFSYFMGYSTRAAEAALGLAETFNIMVILLGFFALVFQIPLLVMLAIMMGVTTRRWLEDRRLYFWMGFGGVAFIFSPDPTGMAPLLVALTMIGLFEGTLLLLRWTGKDSPVLAPEPMRNRRPYAWIAAAIVGYAVSPAPLPTSYYDRLPAVVTDTLANLGWTAATPLIAAVAIVAVFEIVAYAIRSYGVGPRIRLWLIKIRWPWWVAAAAIGYLASPDPGLLEAARETTLSLPLVAAIVLGIAVLYEIAVQLVVWRRGE